MSRPSPALVVAIIALVVSLTGTTWAVTSLPRNSVGSKQIKKNAVRSSDIKAGAVRGSDVRDGSLGAAEFAPGTLLKGDKGDKGDTGATGAAAPKAWALVRYNGIEAAVVRASDPAITVERTDTGRYLVDFKTDVSGCGYLSTVSDTGTFFPPAAISTTSIIGQPTRVGVFLQQAFNNLDIDAVDRPFTLAALC